MHISHELRRVCDTPEQYNRTAQPCLHVGSTQQVERAIENAERVAGATTTARRCSRGCTHIRGLPPSIREYAPAAVIATVASCIRAAGTIKYETKLDFNPPPFSLLKKRAAPLPKRSGV